MAAFARSLGTMRQVTVAACQFACSWNVDGNLDKAEALVRQAHEAGANIILLQELFQAPYFCQEQKPEYYDLAKPVDDHPAIQRFSKLAAELKVVLPLSYFERSNNAFFNSAVVIDADGTVLGNYRKSHIPDGPGYQEKFYFSPGDTGFKVFSTKYADISVLICWDQWFPEGARACALQGAEVRSCTLAYGCIAMGWVLHCNYVVHCNYVGMQILFYPTAIGSEPQDATINSYPHWIRVMQGHAGANMVPVVASNRIGMEKFEHSEITFYGGSFIAGPTGEIVAQTGKRNEVPNEFPDPKPEPKEGFVTASFDLDEIRTLRAGWGLFRDRRPELYSPLLTLDGKQKRYI